MSSEELPENQLAHLRATFAAVPYAHFLGMTLGEIKRGEAHIHLRIRDELKQNRGVVHGGVIASLLDTATAFAVVSLLEPGERVTTTDLTIHYLRPVTGGELAAVARIIRSGRRLSVLSAEVFDHEKSLIATAVTSYIRLSE
jgi:uncharacterized protein (TIGR00369 family)